MRSARQRGGKLASGLALCLALSLFPAAAASAAIYDLSGDTNAERPDIAVGADGTAHVAWNLSAGIPNDDQLIYCRVPRGARACDLTRTISLRGTDFDGPQVVLTRSGEIVVASRRCCFPGAPVFAVTSSDGGASFGPPVKLADEFSAGAEWEAALGPGDFSLALSGGNSGPDYASIWRAAPLDGADPAAKAALAPFPKAYFTSTGFPAPTTPIAAYSDLEDVYLRRWSGAGDYNDAGTWLPEQHVVHGGEPKLASGARGVYLIYRGANPPYQYFVRRFDGTGFPGGRRNQRLVSDRRSGQSAIFRDFFEDEAGVLHAVFRQRSKGGVWGLRHRVSVDGNRSWAIETLAAGRAANELFNLRVGAGPRGGAVVGDHNGEGPVWFAPFPPRGPGGGACAPTVKIGKAIARALSGCFKRHGKQWVAGGAVKLNGVDIEPLGGGGKASASAAFHVTAQPGPRILRTSGAARVQVGNVVLEKGKVAWRLPAGDGKVVRLGVADGSAFRDLGKYAKKLLGFPVDGDAELLIAGTGAEIPTYLRLPGLIGGMTGETTLRTDQAGQVLAGMKVDVKTAAIGLLHLGGIDVTYDGAGRFTGSAKIALPPAYSKPVAVTFAFEDGELSRLEIDPAIEFNPTLPIVGTPPSPILGLDEIGFEYVRKPGSRLFQGNLVFLAGPKLFGLRAVDLKGTVALEFPQSSAATLKATGALSVVRLPLANASATYVVGSPGTFKFSGSYDVAGISGSLDGYVDLASGSFSASGGASLGGLLGGKAVISNSGFGVCIDNPLGDDPGISWKWSSSSFSATCPGSGAGASATASAATAAAPSIRASVRGSGRRRALRFRLAGAPGQRVTFAEQAPRVYREIGVTRKARGALRFHPAPGPGGKRAVVAIVERDGIPVDKLTVARYEAPPTRRPRRPRRVLAKRRAGRLLVRWSRVAGARGYQVRVNLPRDGRRLLFFPPPKRHRLVVRGIERSDMATVSVAAIGPDLRGGARARAKLKPKKPRKRHHGRRRR